MSVINLTELRNPASKNLDQMEIGEILRLMNAEDFAAVKAVQQALPRLEKALVAIVKAMQAGGRLFYVGAGTSGRLGVLDAAECPPTFGVAEDVVTGIIAGGEPALRNAVEGAEDDHLAGAQVIAELVSAADIVVGLAASGRTPYVLGAIGQANNLGALTIGICCNTDSPLAQSVDYPIEILVGPEIVTGSTRLKAGTAQKLILNMISTTVMVQLGKVYGNLMINVQATNTKLRQRVIRIIQEAAGVDETAARRFCEAADGDARLAILMIRFRLTATQARQALAAQQDHFGRTVSVLAAANAVTDESQTL